MRSFKIRSMAVLLAVALTACSAFTGQVAQTDDSLQDGVTLGNQTKNPGIPAASAPAQAGKKSDAAPRTADTILNGTPVQPAARAMPGIGKNAVSLRAGSDNASSQSRGAMIALNFDNADIFEVINALSDFLI
jgi:hypothetical protein